MQPPVLLPLVKRYPAVYTRKRLPANSKYKLQYAKALCRKHVDFQLIEQCFDAKDAYLCLIEIHARMPIAFKLTCACPDLYWLYQLSGSSQFSSGLDQAQPSLRLRKNEYALVYADNGDHELFVKPGKHMLLFFMVNARWLMRSVKQDFNALQRLLKGLDQQQANSISSPILSIHDHIQQQLLQTINLSPQKGIMMDAHIYESIATLIRMSQQDLEATREEHERSLQLVKAVRQYIQAQIREGELLPLYEIVQHFQVSLQYVRRIHQKHYGYTLQEHIAKEKAEEAMRLLKEEGLSPSDITYRLGYSALSSFSRQFKQHFGISPRKAKFS